MSASREPRRLLDQGDRLRSVLRDALEAERGDAPDPARLARIEQAFAAKVAPPAEPTGAAGGLSSLGAKGAIALLVAVGLGALAFSQREAVPPAPPPATTVVTAPEARPAESPAPAQVTAPTVRLEDLPTVTEPQTGKRAPAPRASVGSPAAADENVEIALLARAQDALHGRPAEALALCREHEARFASGHFAQEREAVAIEALVYLNRRAEAEQRWSAFRTRYPTSSHRVHLETLFSTNPSGR